MISMPRNPLMPRQQSQLATVSIPTLPRSVPPAVTTPSLDVNCVSLLVSYLEVYEAKMRVQASPTQPTAVQTGPSRHPGSNFVCDARTAHAALGSSLLYCSSSQARWGSAGCQLQGHTEFFGVRVDPCH